MTAAFLFFFFFVFALWVAFRVKFGDPRPAESDPNSTKFELKKGRKRKIGLTVNIVGII